ncbi:MAG: ATP-binding protein [Gammaproteobacteria bacterium]|nr:ATP-binding protein [Gammaproteobacteria bacterium]
MHQERVRIRLPLVSFVKIGSRIRGPRLATKLMLLGLALLVVPWFSYLQLVEMERLLIQGQSHAQLLTAEGISTLFNGREDLFNDLPINLENYESLYVHPLQRSIRLDGNVSDWGDDMASMLQPFGADDGELGNGDFELVLGERGGQLYAYMQIYDDVPVYRNPAYLRLDNADHVRINYIRPDGDDGRITITLPNPGVTTAYHMDQEWRFAETGAPDTRVPGFVTDTDFGYQVEFRLPLSFLGSQRYFSLSFVDVDDPESREIRTITQTLPTAGKESFNLVIFRSPELSNIIRGLGYSGARILVIDPQQRVRAETGSYGPDPNRAPSTGWILEVREWFRQIRPWIHRVVIGEPWAPPTVRDSDTTVAEVISASLEGEPIAVRRKVGAGVETIMAAHPIISKDSVLGTVVVEQNIDEILTIQRAALEQVLLVSVLSLLAVFLALIAFSGRLAWRIRHLRREAAAAIDQHGRLRTSTLKNEMFAGDEIGDLARSVSNMLSRLHQHNTFLENMPRTLRHEINNPLNTLSTSLQNLEEESEEVRNSKYLESAKRGVLRIGQIVQNLADAANLEDALQSEELMLMDIQRLVENYVNNCKLTHPNQAFVFRGLPNEVYARVSDYRIEQLLDKIVDNAIDFARTNSPIKVQLDTYRNFLQITVANRGPTLPQAAGDSLFESMVSHRGPQNRLHFGLGLYVVRVIAEYHGGSVRAINLTDGSGVAIMVQLPLVVPEIEHASGEVRAAATR